MQIPSATFAKFCYLRYVSAVPSTCSILGQWVPNRECLCGYGEKNGMGYRVFRPKSNEWLIFS